MDTIDCPVCPNRDIPPVEPTCEGCGTDLTPLWRLRELADRSYNDALVFFEGGNGERALEKLHGALEAGGDAGRCRLLAGKIHWQQRSPTEAIRQWRSIDPSDPLHPTARELIAAAEVSVRRKGIVRGGAMAGAATLLMLLPVSVLLLSGRSARETTPTATPSPADAMAPEGEGAPREPTVLDALYRRLGELPTITVGRESGQLRVVFRDGLFDSGSDSPSDAGRAALEGVTGILEGIAATLADSGERIVVEVVGLSDNIPPRPGGRWRDNWSLAFSRAHSVVELMRTRAEVPQITWLASSSGEENAPDSNDTEEGRARNRTVELHVRRQLTE